MSKEETVEVTVRVSKRLMDLLEDINYFGWQKDDFFSACVVRGTDCEINDMEIDKAQALEAKHHWTPALTIKMTKQMEI